MALVRKFTRLQERSGRAHPTEVDCGWSQIQTPTGTLLQLDTYGSDNRASEPKVSQTLQLDRSNATELRRILDTVFP
jgi:hypothetical protein